MNVEHTPGPWVAITNDSGSSWDIHHKSEYQDGGYFCTVDSLHWTKEAKAIARANARLVAAAPELLAACYKALHLVEENNEEIVKMVGSFGLLLDLQNAIARATARAPAQQTQEE